MLQRALSVSGGGGSIEWQYGAHAGSPAGTITADHNTDKIIVVNNLSTSGDFSLTIKGTTYHKANASETFNTGANYLGFGMCYYVLEIPIAAGDTITYSSTNLSEPDHATFVVF